jgi:hypothetical protein
MTYDPKHEARALDALAKDMGLHDPANVDAGLGLPLVMTGPDSTRTLDNLTKWGVRLYGPDLGGNYEWRTNCDRYWWSGKAWVAQTVGNNYCSAFKGKAEANPPTLPPPDWQPHDGTKPVPTTPCRTDAASLSEVEARVKACEVVEDAAFAALLGSGLTLQQLAVLRGYRDSVYQTRCAVLDREMAREKRMFDALRGGAQ